MAKKIPLALFILFSSFVGYLSFKHLSQITQNLWAPWLGILIGAGVAGLAIIVERLVQRLSFFNLIGGVIGLLLGLGLVHSLSLIVKQLNPNLTTFFNPVFSLFFGYLGLVLGGKKFREICLPEGVSKAFFYMSEFAKRECPKVVDTSAIIDGRLADMCETGWVDGPLIIPSFVLAELQHIADSSDPLKRARGRRGLDTLRRIQDSGQVEVRLLEKDYPKIKEIDDKLIELCREIKAKLITTDYNLNKVAQLKGLRVLNVNELALALKPLVSPGEILRVSLIKEGKERHQGVGYLDDGTMVVVENGRPFIGKEVEVVVTSLLQTPAGRIVFAQLKGTSRRAVA